MRRLGKRTIALAGLALTPFLTWSCTPPGGDGPADVANPLLAESWDTPFGVPPLDRIRDEHYMPAFLEGMERQKGEVDVIATDSAPPTFDNTLVALERSGALLDRVSSAFYPRNAAHTNDNLQEVAREVAPLISAHSDDIGFNMPLFDRVHAVFEQRKELGLSPEQMRLLEETHKTFVRRGINLPPEKQERIREINSELSELTTLFGENLLAETNEFELLVEDEKELEGLPGALVATAASEASRRGHEGKWIFTLQRPSINPFLQYSPDRDRRKRIFDGYALRGDNGNDKDNKSVLARIVELRAERADLMGYPSHAHFILEDRMAEDPDRVFALMDRVWKPAREVARREAADLEAMMHDDGIAGDLQPSDWRYYTEKVRAARYDLDEEALRPYFEVTAVRDGAFDVATKLWGITFEQRNDLPTWHEDQETFEVKDADGSHIGILYLDFFIRKSKRGGAWATDLRSQSKLDGDVKPVSAINFNFPPPTEDAPSLLSFNEASTMFHEFGHAVHDLFSDVTYESLSGTNVARDYVEFPSQVMENWMSEPEVLRMFAKHHETGETIPDELIEKLNASKTFNQGFATVEYMAAAYLDLAYHALPHGKAKIDDVDAFEEEMMAKIGLIDTIIPRYRSTYFSHVFSGGYSAGYYSYLWSEVLDADAFAAFKETGLFDQDMARKFRTLLSRGNSRPGMELYREFRGRDPEIEPLLERRGFLAAR